MRLLLAAFYLSFLTSAMASFATFAPSTSAPLSFVPQREPWHPSSDFKTFGAGLDVSNLTPEGSEFDIKKVSIAFVAQQYSRDPNTLFYRNGYEDDTTKHAFLGQTYNGIPFSNEVNAHVVFAKRNNKVVTLSASLATITIVSIVSSTPTITLEEAIKSAEETLHGTYDPPSNTISTSSDANGNKLLEYLANPDGSVTLIYPIPVRNDSQGTAYLAYVDAHKGTVAGVVNYVAN